MARLTVATYNVCHGKRLKQITENVVALSRAGADIICLQEAHKIPGKTFVAHEVQKSLGRGWSSICFVDPTSDLPHRDLGLATFWRTSAFAAAAHEQIYLPRINKYHLGRQLMTLRSRPAQRGALISDFDWLGGRLRVVNVHLDLGGGAKHRTEQMSFLSQSLKKSRSGIDQEILCGDLNTVGLKTWRSAQEAQFRLALGPDFQEVSPDIRRTLNIGTQNSRGLAGMPIRAVRLLSEIFPQRLDHVWIRRLEIEDAGVLYMEGSDHFPLIVSLKARG